MKEKLPLRSEILRQLVNENRYQPLLDPKSFGNGNEIKVSVRGYVYSVVLEANVMFYFKSGNVEYACSTASTVANMINKIIIEELPKNVLSLAIEELPKNVLSLAVVAGAVQYDKNGQIVYCDCKGTVIVYRDEPYDVCWVDATDISQGVVIEKITRTHVATIKHVGQS